MTDSAPDVNQQPLRLLMTADAVGGVWQYSVDLISELTSHGAQVLLATMGPRPSKDQRRQVEAIPGLTLVESEFALEWMQDPWDDIDQSARWLVDLAATFDANLIHLNGYAHASMPWGKPSVVVGHSCVYSWWKAVYGCGPGLDWAEYKRRALQGLAAATRVVAPSRYMAGVLHQEYGVPEDKLQVIHNFSRIPASVKTDKQPFALAAGRIWDPAKNLRLLEQIAPRVSWPIHVAGSDRGPEESAISAESVLALGTVPHSELLQRMEAASIFLHPALYEPFGLSVLEAARAGCCLVLSDIPSFRELWDDSALFIDPRDPDRWVFEINAIIDDPARRDSLAARAVSRAESYRPEAAIERYRNLYQSLLSSAGRAAKEAAA